MWGQQFKVGIWQSCKQTVGWVTALTVRIWRHDVLYRWNLTLCILTLGSRQFCILKKRGKIAMLIGKRNLGDTLKISPMKWFGCVVQMPPGRLLDEALWAPPFSRQSSLRPRTCHMGLRLSAGPGNASGDSWNSWTWPVRGKSATLFRPQVEPDKWHKKDGWIKLPIDLSGHVVWWCECISKSQRLLYQDYLCLLLMSHRFYFIKACCWAGWVAEERRKKRRREDVCMEVGRETHSKEKRTP